MYSSDPYNPGFLLYQNLLHLPAGYKNNKESFQSWDIVAQLPTTTLCTNESFVDFDVGSYKRGDSNPNDPSFDDLSNWSFNGSVLEIRIPGHC